MSSRINREEYFLNEWLGSKVTADGRRKILPTRLEDALIGYNRFYFLTSIPDQVFFTRLA